MPLHALSKFQWLVFMYLWPWRRGVGSKTDIFRGLIPRPQKHRWRKTDYWDFENEGRDITFDPQTHTSSPPEYRELMRGKAVFGYAPRLQITLFIRAFLNS